MHFDLRGRQAALIVASTIFQIAFQRILWFGEAYFLHKLHTVFKITQLHFERFVKVFNLFSTWRELANQLHSVELLDVKSGRSGASTGQISRIDVPTGRNLTCEYQLRFGGLSRF